MLYIGKMRPSVRAEDRERERRALEFDRRFGVDTVGQIHQTELDGIGPNQLHAGPYGASDPKSFMNAMQFLSIDYRQYIFVDFGSGKGRAILMATEFPFKKIIGVEFSRELHEIALANLERFRGHITKCADVEPLWMDAVDYVLPEENLVCYFCNPFNAFLMGRVLANIRGSLIQAPRDIYLVYYNPLHPEAVHQSGCFKSIGIIENISIWRAEV